MAQMDTIAVRISDTDRATLEALAKSTGQTMGAVVRAWLRSEAEKQEAA
jgi:predicted DNA-binding protein